jgi:hypothetical protein
VTKGSSEQGLVRVCGRWHALIKGRPESESMSRAMFYLLAYSRGGSESPAAT